MNVLHLSTYDTLGGASVAAYRLHTSLRAEGVDSRMLVQNTAGDDPSVVSIYNLLARPGRVLSGLAARQDHLPLRFYPQHHYATWWSVGWFPTRLAALGNRLGPALVHCHWVGNGFVPIGALPRFKRPIVWTLHDMWPFTGGCHHSFDCERYQEACGRCPQLGSRSSRDLSRWVWGRKHRQWRDLGLTIVTPSRWLADCARASSLLGHHQVEVIPYGLDLASFRPVERDQARRKMGLPQDKKLILFGAVQSTSNVIKGFHLLEPTLKRLSQQGWAERVELIVFGSSESENPPDFGLRVRYLGQLASDQTLANLYSAADVFVAPSLQDNLPNTVLEAMACGVPCVAFEVGGMPDLIEHRRTGYLARPYETDDLAGGLAWVLDDEERRQKLARLARERAVAEFDQGRVARRYIDLYREILDDAPSGLMG